MMHSSQWSLKTSLNPSLAVNSDVSSIYPCIVECLLPTKNSFVVVIRKKRNQLGSENTADGCTSVEIKNLYSAIKESGRANVFLFEICK